MKKETLIPLNDLLLEDTEEVKKLKSIYKKEAEYARILGPIAQHYLKNKKLKDKEEMLGNI